MASSAQPLPSSRRSNPRWTRKHTLWLILGLLGISVIFSTELPILRDKSGFNHDFLLKLIHDRRLFIPHALCGIAATFVGPLQFSTRLRRNHLTLHRILGRVYVAAIFIAAPTAIIISWGTDLTLGTNVQAGLWMFCTLIAFLTARNRHIAQHRQWMIRSYAVTFTFISLRALNFIPAWLTMSDPTLVRVIILDTLISAFVIPDIAFHWREITRRRT